MTSTEGIEILELRPGSMGRGRFIPSSSWVRVEPRLSTQASRDSWGT